MTRISAPLLIKVTRADGKVFTWEPSMENQRSVAYINAAYPLYKGTVSELIDSAFLKGVETFDSLEAMEYASAIVSRLLQATEKGDFTETLSKLAIEVQHTPHYAKSTEDESMIIDGTCEVLVG